MILLIPSDSILQQSLANIENLEPVLYSLDEFKDMSFQQALDNHSQVTPVLFSQKMAPLYLGQRQKQKNGKYQLYAKHHAEIIFSGKIKPLSARQSHQRVNYPASRDKRAQPSSSTLRNDFTAIYVQNIISMSLTTPSWGHGVDRPHSYQLKTRCFFS